MSKILKANRIKVDSDNKINIDVPVFKPTNSLNTQGTQTVNHEINFENFDEISLTDNLENNLTGDFENELSLSNIDDSFQDMSFNGVDNSQSKEDILNKAVEEANQIIDDAKAEAEKIVKAAIEEAEVQKNAIFENAQNEGYENGIRAAEEETANLRAEAEQTLSDAINEKNEIIDSIEEDMVQLISDIVSKLLSKSLDVDNSVILNLIKQGLSQTTITGEVFIRVSNDDYDVVFGNKEEFNNYMDSNTSLEIIKDMSLDKGDCVIETPFGNIDCSLGQQFKGLKDSLYYVLRNG